jgi:hypothetical protein
LQFIEQNKIQRMNEVDFLGGIDISNVLGGNVFPGGQWDQPEIAGTTQMMEASAFRRMPASISVSGTDTRMSSEHYESTKAPTCPLVNKQLDLLPVPLKLIPIVNKHFSDRHIRETYKYYVLLVDASKRTSISATPDGMTEKHQWKEHMKKVGREVRFLGRKEYKKAVEDTIREKCLTMECGQNPTSWHDCMRALFDPTKYDQEQRELVYWIQFGMLKEGNNAWIHRQEVKWCADMYGIQIVYDKNWEGNQADNMIDDVEHGTSFLPFERARGSWFKWYFLKGANEVREKIQNYSIRAHGIYERISVSRKTTGEGEAHLRYTKRRFVHGDGYVVEPINKRRKQEIAGVRSTLYTMEGVTAWLKAQGKTVVTRPFMDVLQMGVHSDVSSVTGNTSTCAARAGARLNVAMNCVANDLNTIVPLSRTGGDVNNVDDDILAEVEEDDESMGERNDIDWATDPLIDTDMMAETTVSAKFVF